MPRSDQSIRQWIILRLIETYGKVTLPQVAAELSDDRCHERTLRRDLEALGHAGFPIYTERVDGKTYWVLSETHRRFALPLTASELFALQCGGHLLTPLEGTFVAESLKTLYQKIHALLPVQHKDYLSLLNKTLEIGIPPYKTYKVHQPRIEQIRQAIEQGRTIEIDYTPLRTHKSTKRKVDPYRLWFYNGTLYLIGHCHERKEMRTFNVERIRSLRMTDHPFQIDLFFSIEEYFKNAFGVFRGEAEPVSLLFEKPAARWVAERQWHASQLLSPVRGGKVRMDFQLAITPELTHWVLGFGAQVKVVAPPRLKRLIENEAWKVVGKYQKEGTKKTTRRGDKQRNHLLKP